MERRITTRALTILAATAAVVAASVGTGGGLGVPERVPGKAPATDISVVKAGMGLCGTLIEVAFPNGKVACTHGADPAPSAPPGVTVPGRASGVLIGDDNPEGGSLGLKQGAATQGIACYGNGTDGNRVHLIYARPSDRPDRFGTYASAFKRWAVEMDQVFQNTAAQYGASRRVRFLTDSSCNLVLDNVVLSPLADLSLDHTMAELASKGYDKVNRKYLVWLDTRKSRDICGIAAYYPDERLTNNLNDGNPAGLGVVARVDPDCWGRVADSGESVEAHELMHSLGAVLPNAPHSTEAGHCEDDRDRMCYQDGTALSFLTTVCPAAWEALFDCKGDDYFNPSKDTISGRFGPIWNAAKSTFLGTGTGIPNITVSDISVLEGDSGTRDVSFAVNLSTPSASPVSVKWATFAQTATSGADVQLASGTLYFSPGQTTQPATVRVVGDTVDEGDEIFRINLGDAVGGPIIDGQGVGTILDDDPKRQGYWMVGTDGGIFAFGAAPFKGSTGNIALNRPINGMVSTPSGDGYWMVADDGGIFTFGDAGFFGSTGDKKLDKPIVGIATRGTGDGYWLAGADGKVFNFGSAPDLGGTGAPSAPIVGIAATASGAGYWLAGSDGRVYRFGDAPDYGSASSGRPILGMTGTPSGKGYWLVNDAGQVFAFGDAPYLGNTPPPNAPIVGIASSPTGLGYWVVGADGGIFSFGDAPFLGSTGNVRLNKAVVGMSAMRR
jgi:hypothetical protein